MKACYDTSSRIYRIKSAFLCVQGDNLDLAIHKHEVEARIGQGVCTVKTLTRNHLYCEPPAQQPYTSAASKLDGLDNLPEFTVSQIVAAI